MGKLAYYISKRIIHRVITFIIIVSVICFLVDYSIVTTGTTPYDYLLEAAQTQPSAYNEYLIRIKGLGLKQEQIIRVEGDYKLYVVGNYTGLVNVLNKIASEHHISKKKVNTLLYYINRSISYNRIPIVGYKKVTWGTQTIEQLTIIESAPRASNNYVMIYRGENLEHSYRTIDLDKGTVIIIDSSSNILTSRRLGFIMPWYERIAKHFIDIITFNFGESSLYKQPVLQVIGTYLPFTLGLVGLAFLIGMSIGFILAFYLTRKRRMIVETSILSLVLGIRAMPVFWLGMIALYLFAYVYGWFPSGLVTGFTKPVNIFSYISAWFWATIIPALVLSKIYAVQYLLSVRSLLLDEWRQDYVVTLRGVGFPDSIIAEKHITRNIAPPIITLMAIDLGFVFGGAVVTETVFGYPGIGSLTYKAIVNRDTSLIIGIFTIITIVVLISITLAEFLYSWLDPRIRR